MTPLLVVAGEASADVHAARLLAELRCLNPDLAPFGIGGDRLAAQGMEILTPARDMALVGFVEVLRHLRRIRGVFHRLLREVDRRAPTVAVLLDYPDFNLRLAAKLVRRGVRVVYYISPQLWAWRPGRVGQVRRNVHRMLVVFPFEKDFYARHGVAADFVGHPLLDAQLPESGAEPTPGTRRPLRIALLPGSRSSEVRALLPIFLDAATRISAALSEPSAESAGVLAGSCATVRFTLLRASTVANSEIDPVVRAASFLPDLEIVTAEEPLPLLAGCDLALVASGTATLEAAIAGTPMIVAYRLSRLTFLLARRIVKVPLFALVNIVAGRRVVPELLQDDVSGARLASEALAILRDSDKMRAIRDDLAEVRVRLGGPGASRRAAAIVSEVIAHARR